VRQKFLQTLGSKFGAMVALGSYVMGVGVFGSAPYREHNNALPLNRFLEKTLRKWSDGAQIKNGHQ
jgi:hypothetical protein